MAHDDLARPPSPAAQLFNTVSRVGTMLLLLLILVIATGEMVHGQLLRMGESIFGDTTQHVQYFMLRADPVKPDCNPDVDVEAELARQQAQAQQSGGANVAKDAMDDLFEPLVFNAEAKRQSLKSTLAICQGEHKLFQQVQGHLTTGVKAYRMLETAFFALFQFGANNRGIILLALLGLTAAYTTAGHHHICLRPPRYRRDYQAQSLSMLALSGLMLYSCVRYYQIAQGAGVPLEDERTHLAWIAMFGALTLACLWRLARPRYDASTPAGDWGPALQSVPLIATMGLVSGAYFMSHGHPSGLAIYANKLMDIVSLPLALALHIWAGMLFKQSRLVDLFMNILRPWKLSPEALTYLILLAAGLPTAYAGVSSVFVIAAGAIVYHEIRAVGGSSQYALASTAMSGSLGVVLSPNLLVVGIAAMNRQVTTSQLFHWGLYVFALTSTMFFLASQWHRWQRGQKAAIAPVSVALPAMLREMKAVVPFVLVIAAILVFYEYALDTPFNEISAPSILPIMMLLVLVFDRRILARQQAQVLRPVGAAVARTVPVSAHGGATPDTPTGTHTQPAYAAHRKPDARGAVRAATQETVEHVGAYICLILFTQPIGGLVERSEIMNQAPETFSNIWIAMAFLVVAKVVLGMVMEPLGAIVLVSSTLAPLAYKSGIDPVHFWMMVLVAFELGYLLPPVALNHLITRQVVGEAEMDQSDREVAGLGFYRRNERWLLPMWVMSLSLAIVAFGPLAVQRWAWLHPFFAWMH
jgi:TRAP-type C4-dicarboxylate transport system permease large subunit